MHSLGILLRILLQFLGLVCFLLCLAALGVIVWLWLSSGSLLSPLAEQWYEFAPQQLNLTQAITQRYLHPALWDKVLAPLLLMASWKGLGIFSAACFIASSIFGRIASWVGGRREF